MNDLTALLQGWGEIALLRLQWLSIAIPAGFFVGGLLARAVGLRGVIRALLGALQHRILRLDRPARGAATQIYRGLVVLLLTGLAAGAIAWGQTAMLRESGDPGRIALLALVLGLLFDVPGHLALLRAARAGVLALAQEDPPFLHADTHGRIRVAIEALLDDGGVRAVCAACGYIVAGAPGLWLILAVDWLARLPFSPWFGWAIRHMAGAVLLAPRLLGAILLVLAALLSPGAKPHRAWRARSWRALVAEILGITLGGPGPCGLRPWVGRGSAKLQAADLLRAHALRLTFVLLLTLLCAAQQAANLINLVINQ